MSKKPPMVFWDLEISYKVAMERLWSVSEEYLEPPDIWDLWPFGISVGAIKFSNEPRVSLWYDKNNSGEPYQSWTLNTVRRFVQTLWDLHKDGFKIFTMNGTGFDWQLLYRLTQDDRCIELALKSYDPCFQMLCQKGFPVGLEAIAVANSVDRAHKEMDGAAAPKLWYLGEYDKVMSYVSGDVIRLEGVVYSIVERGGIRWITAKGGLNFEPMHLLTVEKCLTLPIPDTSWMTLPKTREDTLSWMPS